MKYLCCLLLTVCVCFAASAQTRVVFFNPGLSDESFWGDVDRVMQAGAEQLDLDLEIIHADRNHFRMIGQVSAVANRPELPGYVILVNEKQSATKMLQSLYRLPIYVSLILNDIDTAERQVLMKDPHWQKYLLPAIVPDNRAVGEETANALMAAIEPADAGVVIISGDKSTPASVQRTFGAQQAFEANDNIRLEQIIHGQWQEARAYEQTLVMLKRYPHLAGIWTANDHMAFGALRAVQDKGLEAGKDIFISSINTSKEVMGLRRLGLVSVLAGRHFLAGGVALHHIARHQETGTFPEVNNLRLFSLLVPGSACFDLLDSRDWSEIFRIEAMHIISGNRQGH